MNLRDYLRVPRRRWLIILGTTVLFAVAATIFTAQLTPQYSATSRVFISAVPGSEGAYQGGLFAEQRVGSYAELAGGPELAERVIDQLSLDKTPAELAKQVDATVVPDTVVLKVEVRDPSRTQAERIDLAVVQQLQGFVRELETPAGKKAALLQATAVGPPTVPEAAVFPQRAPFIGAATLVGLLLGFGLGVLRELMLTPTAAAASPAPGKPSLERAS